jgi:8-oxo-dGTP diphosphatase
LRRNLPEPVSNERGERLLAVLLEPVEIDDARVSLVLAHHAEGVVLVRNSAKAIWELPGGYVEHGETAREGALRELLEESGLTGMDFTLAGLLEIERPPPDADVLKCAVFECRAQGQPSVTGTEVSAVAFWNARADTGPVSGIDAFLLADFAKAPEMRWLRWLPSRL